MKNKMIKMTLILVAAVSLSACGMNKTQRQMVAGAVIGGTAAHLLSDGDTGAVLGGAALGGVVGTQINKNDYRRYYRR